MRWSSQQILSFAPDAPTARRGKELANENKWKRLERNENALWGECESSGGSYYKTQVDLSVPAFKCNCPSRKYPCKHSIGLLLMYIEKTTAFRENTSIPEWVSEWLENRKSRSIKSAEKADDPAIQKAKEQKNMLRKKRLELMASGLEDLEVWLMDLMQQGLASTEGQAYTYWQNISARMVDSKLGGLGKRIKSLPLLQGANTEWPARMLAELTQFYLVLKGFKHLDQLPEPLQEELLSVAGINTKREDLLQLEGIKDEWKVMGMMEGIEDNLNFRRTWVYGLETDNVALILEYSFGEATFPAPLHFGKGLEGELVYYPSSYPLRAIFKEEAKKLPLISHPSGFDDLKAFFGEYAKAVSANPWIFHFPALLEKVIPVMDQGQLKVVDQDQNTIEVLQKGNTAWKLIALSGGLAIAVFGEWTGELLIPLSAIVDGRLVKL